MTYWTYAQVKAKIERDLDLEQETFISPEEMMGYCNEAIDDIEAEIHMVGAEEAYFLKRADFALVSGTALYSLPSDIYANKIRRFIYKSGNEFYKINRVRSVDKFLDIAMENHYDTSDTYRYILVNQSANDGMQVQLVPPSKETSSTNAEIWYIRNANTVTADTDKIDIPEFINVILQHMKVRCYEKEGHPMLQKAMSDLARLKEKMKATLIAWTHDDDNELLPNLDTYEHMV